MFKQQKTILIIDNNSVNHKLYRQYLLQDKNYDYKILTAFTGEEGLEMLSVKRIECVLLDFTLPDMNGLEFLIKTKKQINIYLPPIIILTGQGSEAVAVKAIKNGAADYLIKGETNCENLQQAIHSALEEANLHQELQKSEERFRTSVENLMDCFGIYSAIRDESGQIIDFHIDYVNAAACENNRMTKQEQIGKRLCEILPVHKTTGLFEEYCQVVETGDTLIKKNTFYEDYYGEKSLVGFFDIHIRKLGDGFVACWRDVTENKQLESALRKSEALAKKRLTELESIYATAPVGLCFQDKDLKYIRVNQRLAEINGLPVSEHISRRFDEVVPELSEQLKPLYQQIIETGLPILNQEIHGTTPAQPGVIRNWLASYYPLKTADGEMLGINAMVQEITVQKQVQQTLQKNNQRLELLYEMSSSLLRHEDPKEFISSLFTRLSSHLQLDVYCNYLIDGTDSILHLNAHGGIPAHLTQQFRTLKLGQSICGKVALDQAPMIVANIEQSTDPNFEPLRELKITAFACYPLKCRDELLGTMFFGTCNRPSFNASELALMQVVSDQVATALERKHLINNLQTQAQELTQANNIKDQFLAVLSHELRSPLNPILGWSKLLQQKKLNPDKALEAAITIERNAKLQLQLIEDLLDVSKILRGKLVLSTSYISLEPIITAAIETVNLAADAKKIEIKTVFESNIGLVKGDTVRLQQVVWNLLTNAIKFTPTGGRVEVRLEQVNNHARITVQDTGKGISADFLPHVFDYFRQADSTTTRTFGGLGLGLAIVNSIVEIHGGTVQVESLGEALGATFTVALPIVKMQTKLTTSSTTPETSLEFKNLEGIKVLVVDDEEDSREFIAFVLEACGANVTKAASAPQAWSILVQSQPDVLISDIGMPEMDGYMLIHQVRNLAPSQQSQIPAIALTAYAGEYNQQQAIAAGFQVHLSKPIEPGNLITAVKQLIQKNYFF
jgi:PAS domain S-box-containing protein